MNLKNESNLKIIKKLIYDNVFNVLSIYSILLKIKTNYLNQKIA